MDYCLLPQHLVEANIMAAATRNLWSATASLRHCRLCLPQYRQIVSGLKAPRPCSLPNSQAALHSAAIRCEEVLAPASFGRKQPENAAAAVEHTMRRFWKTVSVTSHPAQNGEEAYFTIDLDKRNLKTPSGSILKVPHTRPLLAALIAQEWKETKTVVKPHSLPLTSLMARAIDGLAEDEIRQKVCDELLKYLETDTICFHESSPTILVQLQKSHWIPLLRWAEERFKAPLSIFTGDLIVVSQPRNTLDVFRSHISSFDAMTLAAFERATLTSKSFLVGLALVERAIDVHSATQAAQVEVRSQVLRWGEVEDTHDVDEADVARLLGSVAAALVRLPQTI